MLSTAAAALQADLEDRRYSSLLLQHISQFPRPLVPSVNSSVVSAVPQDVQAPPAEQLVKSATRREPVELLPKKVTCRIPSPILASFASPTQWAALQEEGESPSVEADDVDTSWKVQRSGRRQATTLKTLKRSTLQVELSRQARFAAP